MTMEEKIKNLEARILDLEHGEARYSHVLRKRIERLRWQTLGLAVAIAILGLTRLL